ncbi:MAG: hypothetical protein Kow00109_06380 [Acidobacteriota bacterium]
MALAEIVAENRLRFRDFRKKGQFSQSGALDHVGDSPHRGAQDPTTEADREESDEDAQSLPWSQHGARFSRSPALGSRRVSAGW